MKKKLNDIFRNPKIIIVTSVIVILCVAILAITLGLSAKIRVARDTAILDKINAQLSLCEESEGKNKTMYEALLDAKNAGYLVSEINSSSENKLVWDQDTDRFILVNGAGKLVAGKTNNMDKKVKLWLTYSSMPDEQTFSIYANDDFSPKDNLLIKVGFDTGDNLDFKKLTYSVASCEYLVIIRTNDTLSCTELVVNSDNASVCHYGSLECLDIKSVGKNGYYQEFGQVKSVMNVNKGIVLLEKNCYVEQLVVDKDAPRETQVEIKAYANVNTLIVDNAISGVKARTNARVKTIVADLGTSNINVDPRINPDEIVKTHVNNESELEQALTQMKKYIVLDSSFSVENGYNVNYNLCLDGNGKTITSNISNDVFLFVSKSNTKLFIKNLKYEDANVANPNSYNTFIAIVAMYEDIDAINLSLFNVNAKTRNECVVIAGGVSADINVLAGSVLEGNSAIYCIGYNCNIVVSNSSLTSTSLDNIPSGAVVVESYNDITTFNINIIMTNTNITLNTLEIADASLYAIDLEGGARLVTANLNSCSYNFSGAGVEKMYSSFSKTYGSKIYKDGVLLYSGE